MKRAMCLGHQPDQDLGATDSYSCSGNWAKLKFIALPQNPQNSLQPYVVPYVVPSCAIVCHPRHLLYGDVHVTWRWKIWKPETFAERSLLDQRTWCPTFHGIPCAPKFTIPGRCCSWHGTNCTPDFFHICQGLYWDCQLGWRDQPEDQNGGGGVEGAWGCMRVQGLRADGYKLARRLSAIYLVVSKDFNNFGVLTRHPTRALSSWGTTPPGSTSWAEFSADLKK